MTTSVSITKGRGAHVFHASAVRSLTTRTRGGRGGGITYYSHRRYYRRPNAPFFCDGRGRKKAFVLDHIHPLADQQARVYSFIPLIPLSTLVIGGNKSKLCRRCGWSICVCFAELWAMKLCYRYSNSGDNHRTVCLQTHPTRRLQRPAYAMARRKVWWSQGAWRRPTAAHKARQTSSFDLI